MAIPLFLTLFAPLAAAIIIFANLLGGERWLHWRQIQRVACGALFVAMVGALIGFISVLADPAPREITLFRWFEAGGLHVDFGFLIDPLSALLALLVTGFAFLIGVFSINYMHKDPGFSRYFSALTLFVFAMLVLILGNNFVLLFLGWESVGLCSYLLIGHYYSRNSAASAATKAFVMNRVGDAGFLAGIFLIILNFGTVQYSEVFSRLSEIDEGLATAIGLCLLAGAIGKSAQLPLGTWLARAMEGPTPSSALIHAATMVTAGVYMITRAHEIFDMAPVALSAVTIIGALTAIYGALVGMTNSDIKGILASSTVTQLGLMFVACGLGAYPVAIFHLVAHAFLKTYLFLTAPSILHYFHNFPDPAARSAPSAPLPLMFWFMLIGSIGFVGTGFGISGFGGGSGLQPSFYVLTGMFLMGLFVAMRHAISATARIFGTGGGHGSHGDHHGAHAHPHDAPTLIPIFFILIVAMLAILFGILPGGTPNSWFQSILAPVVTLSPLASSGPLMNWAVVVVLGALMATAWAGSVFSERFEPELPGTGLVSTRGIYVAAAKRFWLDDFYHKFLIPRLVAAGNWLDAFDQNLVDKVTGTPPVGARSIEADMRWEEQLLLARAEGSGNLLGVSDTVQELGEKRGAGEDLTRGYYGLFGFFANIMSRSAAWVERMVFDRLQGGVARAGGGFGDMADWIEIQIFDRFQAGVARASGGVGFLLHHIEELLGRRFVLVAILLGVIVFAVEGVFT